MYRKMEFILEYFTQIQTEFILVNLFNIITIKIYNIYHIKYIILFFYLVNFYAVHGNSAKKGSDRLLSSDQSNSVIHTFL